MMFKKFEWNYGNDIIVFSILENDNLDKLEYQIKIALTEILSNHFKNLPQTKIKQIVNIAVSTKDINNIVISNIDEEEIYTILDIKLLKSLKESFGIIENMIKNIRLTSNIYLKSSS